MADTAGSLSAALRRSRPKMSGDGYPPALRDRVGRWVLAQEAAGQRLTTLAQQLGISTTTARSWARAAAGGAGSCVGEFLPVVVRPVTDTEVPAGGPLLHTPQGYRVSGLGLNELIAILRGLE